MKKDPIRNISRSENLDVLCIDKSIPLEEYFKYHPPTTQERKDKHEAVNNAAYEFAKILRECVTDEMAFMNILTNIQYARMQANQSITIEDL